MENKVFGLFFEMSKNFYWPIFSPQFLNWTTKQKPFYFHNTSVLIFIFIEKIKKKTSIKKKQKTFVFYEKELYCSCF